MRRLFSESGKEKCSFENGDEDVKMGVCMEKLAVKAIMSYRLNPYGVKDTSKHVSIICTHVRTMHVRTHKHT